MRNGAEMIPKRTPISSKYHQNGSQILAQINGKSSLRRECAFGAFCGAQGEVRKQNFDIFWCPLADLWCQCWTSGVQREVQNSLFLASNPEIYGKKNSNIDLWRSIDFSIDFSSFVHPFWITFSMICLACSIPFSRPIFG